MPFPFQSILRKAIPSKRRTEITPATEDATPENPAGDDAENSVNHDWRADLQAAAQAYETPQSEQFENIDLSGEPDASEPASPKNGTAYHPHRRHRRPGNRRRRNTRSSPDHPVGKRRYNGKPA